MFDLFGLKKETEAEGPEEFASNGEPRGEAGPAKLWAAALVVDSLFVIVFGGAVAAKVYQHWKAPAAQRPTAAAAKKPVEAPKPPPEPAPAQPVPAPAQAPEPPKAAAEPPQEAEPATSGRAVAVDFQLKAPGAKSVELGGAFIVRNNGRKPMVRHSDGTWTLTLYLTPDTYRYFFLVNGKKTLDPKNPKTDRGASVLIVTPR
jgi:hypothetical protein